MNPSHRTHRMSITLAGLAAAVLALPACQSTATTASHKSHHHPAAHVTVPPTQNGLTSADLQDLARVKRDHFRRMAEHSPIR